MRKPVEKLLARIQEITGRVPRATGDGWQADCPAHVDRRASLSLTRRELGQISLKCHAGCTVDAILAGIGWKMDDDVAQQLFKAGRNSPLSNNPAPGHFANPFLPTTERYSYVEQVAPIVARLHECEPTKVEWLWPGRIPIGKLTLLIGDPGLGKSFLSLDLAARITRGDAMPQVGADLRDAHSHSSLGDTRPREPGSVVLLSAEDDISDTIRPRLAAAGADLSRVVAIRAIGYHDAERNRTREVDFSLTNYSGMLEQLIASLDNCRLVVIDPITAYLGGADSHNNAEMRSLLSRLSALAARKRVALLAINHLNKANHGPAIYRSLGSVAFAATARSALAVLPDPYDPSARVLVSLKNNLAASRDGIRYRVVPREDDDLPVIHWDTTPVPMAAEELMTAAAQSAAAGGATLEAADWLTEMLRSGPQSAAELKTLAKADGIHARTLLRAKSRLGLVCRREGIGSAGIWLWQWPDGRPESPPVSP